MSNNPSKRMISANWSALLLLAATLSGCETANWARNLNDAFSSRPRTTAAEEERHRNDYVANHDRQALNWLLRHRIESGMSYATVCKVLGEEGVREARDEWIKTKGGSYQLGDDVYAFGPDNEGHTVYLGFREDKLVDFDPTEFKISTGQKESLDTDSSDGEPRDGKRRTRRK